MFKQAKRLCVVLVLLTLFTVGGVFASWVYPDDLTAVFYKDFKVDLDMFEYIEGSDEMVTGEVVVAEKFAEELGKMLSSPNSTTLDEIVEARKDKGGWFSINELAADDPADEGVKLRELLGLDEFPELTVIIKFTSGTPGYELFTTRVDVDAKDENGNYIIPEEEFENETTFIYPVNRVTFSRDSSGKYVANKVVVGYSRAIYYYETPTSQSTTRTYDVSTWAMGTDFASAIPMENEIIGKEITVQNIDKQKEVYFEFSVGGWGGASTGRYRVTTQTEGLTATIYNSSYNVVNGNLSRGTYYVKLSYSTTEEPENFKFTLSQA